MGKIDSWITKLPRLKNAKVARFSYKAEAYANDDIEGVANYDYSRDMNIPLATHTDFDPDMLSVGARTNFSSIPKNGLNHFFGRVSYNLNKVIDFLDDFLTDFIALNNSFTSFTEIVPFNSSATLSNYADGTTKRLLNTSGSTITITLPAGETYLGSNTIPLEPSIMLTITKRGTVWVNSSGNAITADKWKTSRNITISDADGTNTGTAVSVDGSENETLKLPATIKANITGNAETADKWKTSRNITISDADGTNTGTAVSVDGSENETLKLPATIKANITGNAETADKWKTARNITISDADGTNTGTAVSVDGSENETLKLPATIKANLTGNATTATKLATARKINGVDFDGTADITIIDVPLGTVIQSILQTEPEGFISCMNKSIGTGGTYRDIKYKPLYEALWSLAATTTTSNVIKLSSAKGASADADWESGKLITLNFGYDGGVFTRAGTSVGTYQSDAIRNITGQAGNVLFDDGASFYHSGALRYADGTRTRSWIGAEGDAMKNLTFDASREVPTANENRPKNIQLNFFMRY